MTIGPENFGNGAAKTEERFTGYRPRSGRDGAPARAAAALGGAPHGGTGLAGSVLSGDVGAEELAPRNGVSNLDRLTTPLDIGNPIASTMSAPRLSEPALEGFREPSFASDTWLE